MKIRLLRCVGRFIFYKMSSKKLLSMKKIATNNVRSKRKRKSEKRRKSQVQPSSVSTRPFKGVAIYWLSWNNKKNTELWIISQELVTRAASAIKPKTRKTISFIQLDPKLAVHLDPCSSNQTWRIGFQLHNSRNFSASFPHLENFSWLAVQETNWIFFCM